MDKIQPTSPIPRWLIDKYIAEVGQVFHLVEDLQISSPSSYCAIDSAIQQKHKEQYMYSSSSIIQPSILRPPWL